jgi:signal transduction histidine kinase
VDSGTSRFRHVLSSAAPTTTARPTDPAGAAAPHRVGGVLHAIATVAAATTDVPSVINAVVAAATELVDADEGTFAVLSADGAVVEFVQHHRVAGPAAASQPTVIPDRAGLLAELIGAGDATRLVDLTGAAVSGDSARAAEPVGALVGMPIPVRGGVFGVLYLTRMPGRPAFTADDEMQVRALGAQAGLAIANAGAVEVARRREEWLQTLTAVATGLSSGRGLADVLPRVIRQARDIVDADFAAVALPSGDPAMFTVQYGDGIDAAHLLGSRVPQQASLTGMAFRTGKMIEIGDLRTDPRVAASHEGHYLFGPALFIPVGAPTAVRGVLVVFNRSGRPPFDRQSVMMLDAFAAQVGVSLELAERRHDDTRLALAEDRERIARDLHDVVIQRLFAIGLTLEGAGRRIADAEAAANVARGVDELDQTIKEIRTTIFGLESPAGADYPSLRARTVAVVDQAVSTLGFVPSLRFDGLIDTLVPDRLSDQVVAVLREALSNVARHARAGHVDVVLAVRGDMVVLSVDDDGVGITESGRRSGLRNMEVRAKASGGRLTLCGREPSGTHVEWQVPLPRRLVSRAP